MDYATRYLKTVYPHKLDETTISLINEAVENAMRERDDLGEREREDFEREIADLKRDIENQWDTIEDQQDEISYLREQAK